MIEADFMHRWFEEVWNNKREDAIDEMFAEDGVGYGLGPENINGPENFKVFHRAFVSAYPNLKVTVEDTVVEGDKIATRSGSAALTMDMGSVSRRPISLWISRAW